MKKSLTIVLILMIIVSLFAFTGCKKNAMTELVVYTESGFPPFEYASGKDIVGVDMEIAKAIADELGMRLVIKDGNFDSIVAGISEDNALGLAGITITEGRKEAVDFSIPYFQSIQYIIYEKGKLTPDEDGLIDIELLGSKKIGVQTGTTADEILGNDSNKKGYDNALIASQDIGINCDYVMIDKHTALQIVGKNANLETSQVAGVELEYYGIAVKKGNKVLLNAVNWILFNLLEDGSIDTWLLEHDPLAEEA